MSQDVMLCVMNSTAFCDDVNVEMRSSEPCVKCLDLDAELLNKQNTYNDLSKKYFKNNNLKAQLHAKDTTICKLKEHIKSMRENVKEEKVKHEMDKIETINIELEHSMEKLLSKNERLHKEIEHLKKIYKDQFDSIKKTCALSKEHDDSLIGQLNSTSMENANLKRQIQDKIDLEPLVPRLLNNREAHIDYLKITQEQADILQGIVEQAKSKQPLDNALDFACKHAKRFQELLVYVRDTCPNAFKPSEKIIDVTPMNKIKKVRITPKKIVHLKETISNSVETPKPEIKVYSRRPKQIKTVGYYKKAKIVESKIANNSKPNHLWGSNATYVPSSSSLVQCIRLFRLFSELGSDNRQLLHLNFGTLNKLAKDGLARGIPKLKFQKDHLCSACALGKSKKSSHQPKAEDTNQEKLYLLHMDHCGPMRVESINEKKCILVIVDDYSRFTWVRILRSKDEAPDVIIKCIKKSSTVVNP
ncbi:integrase, catalytic region, zinc finger, CCHC-type containing protein [Tanacetum coccineum]